MIKLSVIIPAYNEETRIVPTLLEVENYLKKQAYDYEVIVMVNDSTDKTYQTAQSARSSAENQDKIIITELAKPGKGNAVKRGVLDFASGDIILFMDADNATPIAEVKHFFRWFEKGYDVVVGSRYLNPRLMKKRPPAYRVALSRLSNILIQLLAVPGIRDTQLGFKAFTKEAAQDIFPLATIERWAFDIELLAIALAQGYKIKEAPVTWREPGGSHVSWRAYLECLSDLFIIKWQSLMGKYEPPKNLPPKYKKQKMIPKSYLN